MPLQNREMSMTCSEHVYVYERGGQCVRDVEITSMRRQGQCSFWPLLSLGATADGKAAGGAVVVVIVVFGLCVLMKTMFYKA